MSTDALEAKEPFDPVKSLDNLVNQLANGLNSDRGRKLTFEQRCAAYAALYKGVPQILVATAFGISRVSICLLAGCRNDNRPPVVMELPVTREAYKKNKDGYDEAHGYLTTGYDQGIAVPKTHIGGKIVTDTIAKTLSDPNLTRRRNPDRVPRYQDVAREFDQLGETAFIQTYYTAHIEARLKEAAHKRPRYGPDADQGEIEVTDRHGQTFIIALQPDGWRFVVSDAGKPRDGYAWNGDDKDKPFKTRAKARDFILNPVIGGQ